MTFVSDLQGKDWYQSVAAAFSTNAPDVPKEVWMGELLSEDASLDPAQQDYLHSGHWGLFQENVNFPTTIGLPATTVDVLKQPQYNAAYAASAMELAIKNSGATDAKGMVEALERAGWPGAVSDAETQKRLANIASIYQQEGATPPDGTTSTSPLDAIFGPNSSQKFADLGKTLFIGGIIVAGVTGGFALLAGSIGAKSPVPVV